MHGQISFWNSDSRTGTIIGTDKVHYRLHSKDWHGHGHPQVGQPVDFLISGADAVKTRPIGDQAGHGSFTDAIVGEHFTGHAAPSFFSFYFSPNGRVSLRQYWLRYILPCGGLGLLVVAAFILCLIYGIHHGMHAWFFVPLLCILGIKAVVLAWVSFVMHVKRYHDLGMSWQNGYMINNFMPFGRDWMMYRLMCQQGTPGENAFGPDPR